MLPATRQSDESLQGLPVWHLVGASIGGMNAQTVVIEYTSRIKSLTSIMSNTGNNLVGQADFTTLSKLGEPPYKD
ncbi:MAG: hypothetical protein ABIR66_12695 [Saprospiraceae bacterium]